MTSIPETMGLHESASVIERREHGSLSSRQSLEEAIKHACHLLPSQGPITVFIHHNTLHGFEDLPFIEGVREGAETFDCQPFLSEERYRQELEKGRIRFDDLIGELRRNLGSRAEEAILPFATRLTIRSAMLQFRIPRFASVAELEWYAAETDALVRVNPAVAAPFRARLISETRRWVMRDVRGGRNPAFRELLERFGESRIESWEESIWEAFALEALWKIARESSWEAFALEALWKIAPESSSQRQEIPSAKSRYLRHRDLLRERTGVDTDLLVQEPLIRLSAAYLDQGFAAWELPAREEGFFRAFATLYKQAAFGSHSWLRPVASELHRIESSHLKPLDLIEESLTLLGIPEHEQERFLASTMTSLRGWGGMIQQVEERGDRSAVPIREGSLLEFIAVRLLLDRLAIQHVARQNLGYNGSLQDLRQELLSQRKMDTEPLASRQRAFTIFLLAQSLGWSPEELTLLTDEEMNRLLIEVETFSDFERRVIFHLAYERRFRNQTLDAIALHPPFRRSPGTRPRFQLMACLDEREESFRRHLEEIAPDCETFGPAGFFGVVMYFRGEAEAHFLPQCPIVVKPSHWVTEEVEETSAESHGRRTKTRQALAKASHRIHLGSRSFVVGAFLSGIFGALAAIPLIARVWFPRLTSQIRNSLARLIQSPVRTRLRVERQNPQPGMENGSVGFFSASSCSSEPRWAWE